MAITDPKVLLSIIRQVLPNVLASQLVGVQPMTGSMGNIFNTRYDYGETLDMEKVHYQHFIKVPNRRRKQPVALLTELGYPCAKISSLSQTKAKHWCTKNLKPGSWINLNHRFYFAYDRDFTWFSMVF